MREIKLRAWDKKRCKMLIPKSKYNDFEDLMNFLSFTVWDDLIDCDEDKKNIVLMQFTGLKTRSGKEIYEGDIITCRDGKAVIIYEESFGKFLMDFNYSEKNNLQDVEQALNRQDADTCMRSIEVVGNIYENHEQQNKLKEIKNGK